MKNSNHFLGGHFQWPPKFLEKIKPIIILFIVGIVYYFLASFRIFSIPCPLRFVTSFFVKDGIMCPGCGVTKMLICEARLDFASAFSYNQALFVFQPVIFFEIGKLMWGYLFDKKVRYSTFENIILITIGIIIIAFGVYRNLVAFGFCENSFMTFRLK